MNILDEYRRNAKECQRMAENAGNSADKASWLRLAASWLGMIKNDPQPPHDRQADKVSKKDWPDASYEDSKASH